MSATLGAGGDLERLTGRRNITRLAIPEGWDKQGIGRRLFIFPDLSFSEDRVLELRRRLMADAGRSLVLVPSNDARDAVRKDVESSLGFQTFSAEDIEISKMPFVKRDKAVAIVANRYDGIDFPGDDCRLLFVEGLPRATNLQERFIMSRMGANLLFNERVQTRVLQAVGRCTRGLNDFSAVVVTGEELHDYLSDRDRRKYLHPEMQAELEFGIEQSKEVNLDDIAENFRIFIEHGKEWENANQEIIAKRDRTDRVEFPAMKELAAAVEHEINYQIRMWQGDYEKAFDAAREVLGLIVNPELRGYRALWHYLAGSAALLSAKAGTAGMEQNSRDQFLRAKEAARGIPWLVALARFDAAERPADRRNALLMEQIERVENILVETGKLQNRTYTKREQQILEGLDDEASFEQAHEALGQLLGFSVGKIEEDASPDPWWLAGDLCLVFEDHAGAKKTGATVGATKARQAASHVDWINANVAAAKGAKILAVLVSPAQTAGKGALPSLKRVALWPIDEFRQWAREALGVLRVLRTTFVEPGDLDWRARAADAFERNRMDAPGLFEWLSGRIAADLLECEEKKPTAVD
jgi:Helicase C-terminal domain